MGRMDKVNKAFLQMIKFDRGDAGRIQHFTKVYGYAHLIGEEEGLDPATLRILDFASIVHDIGIRPAEEKYGYQNGKLQEEIGPAYARKLLEEIGVEESTIERVEFLVGHHHTYEGVDGADWQILLEADFLVNSYEKSMPADAIKNTIDQVFKTKAGTELCKLMYAL